MNPGTIRVLVVDDSLTVRKRIVEVLSAQPGIEVVGEAADGQGAVDLCRDLRPSVVTLDMVLPVMDGLAATEVIMAFFPTPILIISASFNRGDLYHTYEALKAGAVDVLEKPRGDDADAAWEARLVAAVRMAARIKVITHPRGRLARPAPQPRRDAPSETARSPTPPSTPERPRRGRSLVAMGTSTGGPSAALEVLRALPADFDLPILLCIHIAEPFGAAFADWLDGLVPRPVAYARGGEPIASMRGRVVLAPPTAHLIVRAGAVELDGGAPRHSCRPSVDVLFESVAREVGAAAIGCLMTGMGRDGAEGLLAMRQAGAATIAQDEATSVVYGMPREAARIGAAASVLPLSEIAPALARLQREVARG